ncbi:MAG TPA: type II secretion system F family protein, partial [Gaiellaceae bacterium]|nr:type II secretion system F family protein [Gaiellaceae bacterium]
DAARRAHVGVYPIAVAGPQFDPSPLLELARSTGGSYHRVGSTTQLARVYTSIADELSRTWRLHYTTAARPGDAVSLRASLAGLGSASAGLRIPGLPAPAPPQPSPLIPPSLYSSTGTLVVAGVVFALVLAAATMLIAVGGGVRLRARIDAHLAPVEGRKRRRASARTGLRARLLTATERAFGHLRQWKSLARLLERADLPLRAAEFVYIQLGCALLLGLLSAAAASSALVTLVAMAIGGGLPLGFAAFRARKRLRAFENQLPDLLITLAASLKAGHSFRQGIQTVVDEGRPPASDEFKRVLTETSLGRPMDDALIDMAARVGSPNLEFVITAVTIQRQVGGSLAGLFDMVAEAVRQRQQFARKIRGLTAMGRMSAYVLCGLPLFLAAVLSFLNPSYMSPLYHTSTGHTLILVGLTMMAIGSVVLKKIVSFRG